MNKSRLRWKKEPGLRAIGAGPRPSTLHDGSRQFATVYPDGGNWMRPLAGWYWVCSGDGLAYRNTCNEASQTEEEAKAAAMAYVREQLRIKGAKP